MGIHKRLGAESPILHSGFTADDIHLIFHVMALRECTQLKVAAFQFWHIMTKKKVDNFWIAQDQVLGLFDTIYLNFHVTDLASSCLLSQEKQDSYSHNRCFKQRIDVSTHDQSACAFQLLIIEQGTKVRLSLADQNTIRTSIVRMCVIADSTSETTNDSNCILNTSLPMGCDETSSENLKMNPGSYQVLLFFKEKQQNFTLCVLSSRNFFLRGRGNLSFEYNICESFECNWDVETTDLLPSAWSKFQCIPVDMHPLLFHRLHQRLCGNIELSAICKRNFLCFVFDR
jgi:hypothetical protein